MHQLQHALSEGLDRPRLTAPTRSTLIVGVGSPHGDDRAGWEVVRRLVWPDGCRGRAVCVTSPVDLLDHLPGHDRLRVVDACVGAGDVGDWYRWRWPDDGWPEARFVGTHDLSLEAVLTLGARLELLPNDVEVFGLEIAPHRAGDALDPRVETAAEAVGLVLLAELLAETRPGGESRHA